MRNRIVKSINPVVESSSKEDIMRDLGKLITRYRVCADLYSEDTTTVFANMAWTSNEEVLNTHSQDFIGEFLTIEQGSWKTHT